MSKTHKEQIKELYDDVLSESMRKQFRDEFGLDGAYDTDEQIIELQSIKPHGIECDEAGVPFGQYAHEQAYERAMGILDGVKIGHPLLNADSKHYEMVGGMEAIEIMESIFTVEELKAWAKLTAMKYRLRIGKKDDPTKEIKKIKTFEDYYEYLDNLPTSVDSLS